MEEKIEIVKKQDIEAKEEMSDLFGYKRNEVDSFILRRAIGNSKHKIFQSWLSKFGIDELEKLDTVAEQAKMFSMFDNDTFKEMVSEKKHKMNLIEVGIEEQQLIEKLTSIINGEAQGVKIVKSTTKEFENGKMISTEHFEEIPNYPTTSEQIRATQTLHKLGFLSIKDKAKMELEEEKMKIGSGDIIDTLTDIMKGDERGAELEAIEVEVVKEGDVDLDDIDMDSVKLEDMIGDL